MNSIRMSPNSREVIGAISTITSKQEYLKSTNGALNVAGSFSLSGQAIPASGLTTAVAVQIVDGSGNQIASFGGGTQYTDGGVPPAHPIGNTIEWSDGSNWQTVSTTKPLPVTASFSPSGTQDVNVKQISGTAASVNNGTVDAGTQRVTIASDSTGLIKLATGANTIGAISNTSFAVTNAGTFAVQAVGTLTNNNAAPSTNNIGVLTALANASAPTQTEGDLNLLSTNLTGRIRTTMDQIGGVAISVGNGTAGTGVQRVTIASDNTAFSVNATLSAETTKVIGTVNQGTSPWVVSNSVLSVVGNGAAATAQRVTLANDSTGVIATVGAVTAITNALPAGSNVIGHVITDTGSTTAVTGTVTISGAVTNAGTFAVQLTGATNNINNIAGTITLPTGASTLAEQQTQTTSLQLIDDTITAQGTALGTTKTSLIGGSVTTAAPTYTNGQISPLNLTTAGALRVDAGTVTVTATNLSTNLAQVAGTTTSVNNGAVDAGTQRVTLANNSTGVIATVAAVTAITNALPVGANVIGKVSIDQTTPGTTNLVALTAETTKVIGVVRNADGAGSLWTSNSTTFTAKFAQDSNLLGTLGTAFSTAGKVDVKGADGDVFVRQATASNLNATVVGTGTLAVQNTAATPAGTNAIGTVNLSPTTSGGWTGYALGGANAALTTTQTVSAAAGKFGGYMTLINLNSSPAYIQVFDTTGAVTLGTTPPTYIIAIPSNSTAANGVGANMELSNGLAIANGIKIAATTTSNGSSTVATGVTGTILYK